MGLYAPSLTCLWGRATSTYSYEAESGKVVGIFLLQLLGDILPPRLYRIALTTHTYT